MSTQTIQTQAISVPTSDAGWNKVMTALAQWVSALKASMLGMGQKTSAAMAKRPWLTISIATVVAAVFVVVMIQLAWPAVIGALVFTGAF